MYGNIYNNLYGNSNPYAEPQASESARTAVGDSYGQDAVDEQSTSLKTGVRTIVPLVTTLIHKHVTVSDTLQTFFGKEIREIVLVGLVSCTQSGQRYAFTIQDGFGSISARLYVGQNNADMTVVTSGYARIIGSLSTSSGVHSINIYHMEPVSSFNSITLHFLDVIRSYSYYQTSGNISAAGALPTSDEAISATPTAVSNTVEMVVKQAISSLQAMHPNGVHLNAIVDHLKEFGVSGKQVQNALSELERDMVIYAVDVDTYLLNYNYFVCYHFAVG